MPVELSLVDTLTAAPVVGERYLVRGFLGQTGWLPIIGQPHRDPELGEAGSRLHVHYDFRFLSTSYITSNWRVTKEEVAALDAGADPSTWLLTNVREVVLGVRSSTIEFSHRVRRCHHPAWNFPVTVTNHLTGRTYVSSVAHKMEAAYADASIDPANPICPHRGIRLHDQPVDESNCVRCPGHGLRWNLTTGRIASAVPTGTSFLCARMHENMGLPVPEDWKHG